MRRSFGYDDEEPVWGMDDNEENEGATEPGMFEMMQVDLESQHVNNKVMESTLRLLEKSWFWRFRRVETKLRLVQKVYTSLLLLVQNYGEDARRE